MKRLLIFLSIVCVFLVPTKAKAGTCPSAASYWNSAGTAETNTLSSLGVTNCYYISNTGSDSNAGDSEASGHPWAHLPGMATCTGNCASYTPTAGDGFILEGGDTWVSADLGVYWPWGGTSSNPIYIGVDPSWYSGASWTRPKFDCQSTECTGHFSLIGNTMFRIPNAKDYIIVDNIEWTGWQQNGPGKTVFDYMGTYITVEDCYFHGWSYTTGATSEGKMIGGNISGPNGSAGIVGGEIHDNVIDGADTSRDSMIGIQHSDHVFRNVVRYTVANIDGEITDAHDNLSEYDVVSHVGQHCDLFFSYGPLVAGTWDAYNNVIRHSTCPGGGPLWESGKSEPSDVAYIYNNVLYDVAGAFTPYIAVGNHSSYGNTGTYYVYNNTVDASVGVSKGGGGGPCTGNGELGSISTTYYSNNHCIATSEVCNATGTACRNNGGNLSQTEGQANTDGYSSTETYAYSPTSGTAPTVGAGVNWSSICSGPAAAMCFDTTYATYDQRNHTVVMRTVNARPPSNGGNWDIGAYQFSSSQVQALQPPTNLTATAH